MFKNIMNISLTCMDAKSDVEALQKMFEELLSGCTKASLPPSAA